MFESRFEIHPMTNEQNIYSQCLFDYNYKKNLVLFFNLIPGYRFPYSKARGKFLDPEIYKKKAASLFNLIDKLLLKNYKKFSKKKILTWGNIPRDYMTPHFKNLSNVFNLPHPSI
ncbi:hypothetical protein MAL08_19625 (plasmid) [Leptospira noguchii]|uniref:hypothetical protein n=1 Tax=Leptospira noguchii TaxID=28182 RepID=UPI001FB7D0F9|nr:hypothetical protein [Leptospira noguchii]UOG39958.1 hypothetical protein MAL08_19625 [Leptospira noguchii]